jgi:hypothetical protein
MDRPVVGENQPIEPSFRVQHGSRFNCREILLHQLISTIVRFELLNPL